MMTPQASSAPTAAPLSTEFTLWCSHHAIGFITPSRLAGLGGLAVLALSKSHLPLPAPHTAQLRWTGVAGHLRCLRRKWAPGTCTCATGEY